MYRVSEKWERLVVAVLRREEYRQICYAESITPSSPSSISSDCGPTYSFSDLYFDFENAKEELFLKLAQALPFKTVLGMRDTSVIKAEIKEETAKLIHFEDSPFAFNLGELLMASSFAIGERTYAVSFNEGSMVVVKILRKGCATREALENWMKHIQSMEHGNVARYWGYFFNEYERLEKRRKTIQSMEHENVVRLWGYFFTEYESFGYYDYFHHGNLKSILHGEKGKKGSVRLDWEGRIKIAIGAAKGLLHIHKQSGNTFVHGSVKSSNIFVNSQTKYYGCIYINPEAINYETDWGFSQALDVYSFGVVLIELVTGRSPKHFGNDTKRGTIVGWALLNAPEEWTTMVFDRELLKSSMAKQAMSDVLGVALSCVKKKPEETPKMKHVVEMLQLIRV